MKKLIALLLIAFAAQAGLANNIAGGKDTITIELSKTLKINWSIKASKVVQDSLFIKAKSSKKALKLELLELIPNTTPLDFEACFKKGKVKKGDVAFYLFDEVFNVPYPTAIGKAFPDIPLNCKPPLGLYDYIEANRNLVITNMKAFYIK